MWFGIGGAFVAAASALLWLTLQMGSSGRLKRNYWIGIRTPATLKSDAAWVEGHHAAMVAITPYSVGGVVAGIAALVQIGDESSAQFAFWLAVLVFFAGLTRAAWVGIHAARKAD